MEDELMEEIIKAKKLMKWRDDFERRKEISRAIDFYENKHKKYIEEIIDNRIDKREAEILKKYFEYENLTDSLIRDMSLIFREPPDITDDEKVKDLLDQILYLAVMRDVNKLVNLTRDVGVLPQIRDDQIELDIITADNMFVEQEDDDPTKAKAIYYQVGVLTNTPIVADRIDIYHYWTKEGKFKCYVNSEGYIEEDSIEQLEAPDYDGEIPIIMFRNYKPIDKFFSTKRNAIVDKNEQIDLRLTALNMLEDYNLPQRVNVGVPPEQEMKAGLTFSMDIPSNSMGEVKGDSKFINPQAPVMDEWTLIENRMIRVARSLGLSADTIKGAEYTSGFHYALSKQEIIQKNKEEREYYRKSMTDLIRIILMTANELPGYSFNPKMEIKIDFGEVRFVEDPEARERVRALQMSNGTMSRVDFVMDDNPDLSRDDAIEKIKEIDEENRQYGSTFGDRVEKEFEEEL